MTENTEGRDMGNHRKIGLRPDRSKDGNIRRMAAVESCESIGLARCVDKTRVVGQMDGMETGIFPFLLLFPVE